MSEKISRSRSAMALVAATALAIAAGRASAATFNVVNAPDSSAYIDTCTADAPCSLRGAIVAANLNAGADVILIGASDLPYELLQVGAEEDAARTGDLDILETVAIVGPAVIDAKGLDRVFDVKDGVFAIMGLLTITGGRAPGSSNGGGILNAGSVTLSHCALNGNSAAKGGAIAGSGETILRQSTLEGNSAMTDGGAIFNEGQCIIDGSTFTANSANGNGGSIANFDRTTLTGSTLQGGSVQGNGGAIYNGATVNLASSVVSGNSAPQGGGGGIYNTDGATLEVENSSVSSNTSMTTGGGMFNQGLANLTNCRFEANVSSNGGGIANRGTATLEECTVIRNGANYGGGIHHDAGRLTLNACLLSGNSVDLFGGALALGGEATLTNCTLNGNSSDAGGGGISSNGTTALTNCTLSGNSSSNGAAILGGGTLTLANTIVAKATGSASCVGAIASNGHNLDEDGTCGLSGPGDLVGVDANLAPLQSNGGRTDTMALCTAPSVPDSGCTAAAAALDGGDAARCPPRDQRGAHRPHGPACDIGAFESGALAPTYAICNGDCDSDTEVTIDELVTLVNIKSTTAEPSACAYGIVGGTTVDTALVREAVVRAVRGDTVAHCRS